MAPCANVPDTDLPPSYDDAQTAARNGIAPLDPSQLEVHRLTVNEGPNEPEVWEYRVRGEHPDAPEEHNYEQAPQYESHVIPPSRTVPVHHVACSDSIATRRDESTQAPSTDDLLRTALEFTRHGPDTVVHCAPHLSRIIAIPQEGPDEAVQFLRAYAKTLQSCSIGVAEFIDFIDGLNVLCQVTNLAAHDLLNERSSNTSSEIVHEYLRRANEEFFVNRGLRVSLQSLLFILDKLKLPAEHTQNAGAIAGVLDRTSTGQGRAQALHPWIEALDTHVPSQSSRAQLLREMGELIEQFGPRAEVIPVPDDKRRADHRDEGMSDIGRDIRPSILSEAGPAVVQTHDDPPPSYHDSPAGAEADVRPGDNKDPANDPPPTKGKGKGKMNVRDTDDNDSDASSNSSDFLNPDADSDSDSGSGGDDDWFITYQINKADVKQINEQAELAAKEGIKSTEEIEHERAVALDKIRKEHVASDMKWERRRTKRALIDSRMQKEHKLKEQLHQRKCDIRERYAGKGKDRMQKRKDRREAVRDYREKKQKLRVEQRSAMNKWRQANYPDWMKERDGVFDDVGQAAETKQTVWVLVESCDA